MKNFFLITWLIIMIVLAISVVSFAEDITIRIAWWGNQVRNTRTLEVIKLFEEKYPNVKVQPEFVGWSDYWQKMAVQAAGDNLPDVSQQSYWYTAEFIENDLLLDLNPYIEDNTLNLTFHDEVGISGGRVNNKLYAVTVAINTPIAYFYDPELFKKAGVEEPDLDWTWEDYTEKAKKIHATLGIYGDDPYWMARGLEGIRFYLIQRGEQLFDKPGKKLGYEDDSLLVDYYTRFIDLVKEGVNAPPEISLEIMRILEKSLIVTQESAMLPGASNRIIALTAVAGRPLAVTVWPNAKDQVQYGHFLVPAAAFSVAKNSKYPEWAVKFIDFYVNSLEANKILLAEQGVPPSSKIREGLMPYLEDAQRVMFDYIEDVVEHSTPDIDFIPPPCYPELEDTSIVIYERMLYGELTPEEAAKEFREKINRILAEN